MFEKQVFDKKILMLVCGGVVNMKIKEGDLFLEDNDDANYNGMLEYIHGIKALADIDTKTIFKGFSQDMDIKHWEKLVSTIEKNYNHGFKKKK